MRHCCGTWGGPQGPPSQHLLLHRQVSREPSRLPLPSAGCCPGFEPKGLDAVSDMTFFLRTERSFHGARSKFELTQGIFPEGAGLGWPLDYLVQPRSTALADEMCSRNNVCLGTAYASNEENEAKMHPASPMPPGIGGYEYPPPGGHVGTASVSAPLTVLTSFVGLPKNVAVQLVLLAGPVSQASVPACSWQLGASPGESIAPGGLAHGSCPSGEGSGPTEHRFGPSVTKTAP